MQQTFRALIRSRMQVGVAAYHDRFPRAEIVLLEPDRGDRRMFFANVFRYADRRRLVDHAFDSTRRDLRRRARELAPVLARRPQLVGALSQILMARQGASLAAERQAA